MSARSVHGEMQTAAAHEEELRQLNEEASSNLTALQTENEQLRANIAALGLSEHVSIVRSTSEEAARDWGNPIDLLFIDGDHSYEGVKRDWELFIPHVKPFGVVVFHDTIWNLPPYNERPHPSINAPSTIA